MSLVFVKMILRLHFVFCVQNTASPWLPQSGSSAADGLGLLSHSPMRPASADTYRPTVKVGTHTSASLSKVNMDIHKE